MPTALRRLLEIVKAAGKEFGRDHAGRLAAALSYYTIFSLVPLLFLLVAAAGFIFSDPEVVRDLIGQVSEVAGSDVGGVIEDLLESVTAQRGAALSIGLVLAAFSASGIFLQVQGVLAEIFHVPELQRRTGPVGWVVKRAIALASAVVLALLALVPVVAVAAVSAAVGLLPEALDWLAPVLQLGVPVVSLGLLMAIVGATFKVLTSADMPWKAAMRGGAATAAVGLAAAYLVGVYLSRFGSTGTLGALGGLAILLFFFNLMWTVYLFGAEVTKVYADYMTYGDVQQPSERHRTGAQPGRAVAAQAATPPESGSPSGVLAFVAGFVIAWVARRR